MIRALLQSVRDTEQKQRQLQIRLLYQNAAAAECLLSGLRASWQALSEEERRVVDGLRKVLDQAHEAADTLATQKVLRRRQHKNLVAANDALSVLYGGVAEEQRRYRMAQGLPGGECPSFEARFAPEGGWQALVEKELDGLLQAVLASAPRRDHLVKAA